VLQHYTGLWLLRRYYIFRGHHYGRLWAEIRTYWWGQSRSFQAKPGQNSTIPGSNPVNKNENIGVPCIPNFLSLPCCPSLPFQLSCHLRVFVLFNVGRHWFPQWHVLVEGRCDGGWMWKLWCDVLCMCQMRQQTRQQWIPVCLSDARTTNKCIPCPVYKSLRFTLMFLPFYCISNRLNKY